MALRVLFLNDTQLDPASPRLEASFDDTQVALHPSTIFYLIKHLGVCPIFLSNITITPWLLDTGNALFKTYKQDTSNQGSKSLSSVQGFFCYSVRGRPAHAWYKHDLELGKSTYIIQYCPEGTKTNLMRWATAPNKATRRLALRPMLLETMIIDEVAWNWSKGVVENARKLLAYEHLAPEQYGDGLLSSAVHDLHNLSQHFYIMQEELNGIAEQLEYLGKVHSLISSTLHTKWVVIRGGESSTSVVDSLLFLQSRTRNWHRWVQNWRERTNVRINLFFNLATTKIATETRRDSSSMITIAALTLLFLPGTFISGLFSMPFFQTAPQRLEAGSKRMANGLRLVDLSRCSRFHSQLLSSLSGSCG
ncbi:hypothetical protein DFP72DRAFT_631248 [Ephemerocybe angulata]|uniref:Uncharacterized protein n=1 Tax=Ephemerocybe angulata TaxID=980116 RepID=A0A8H6MDF0_9AGAR|nr:hypothetical protein DFP72DRAFT_631248 [Tulosesus angulatus]